jgi:hypothetical protein
MRILSPLTIGFLTFSLVFGGIIGMLTARVPGFSALGLPSCLWLVAGQFAFEMLLGIVLNTHPSALIAMPLRLGALLLSFIGCYSSLVFLG